MISLPAAPAPASVIPTLNDFGILLRPATGAAIARIDRPGTRWKLDVTMPPMRMDDVRVFLSRLQQGRTQVLRMAYPLLGVVQGPALGAPLVNGGSASGLTLPLRGLRVGAIIREGWWITVMDAAGNRYLHSTTGIVIADGSGHASVPIYPMLRAPLADGATVLLENPTVEGLVTSALSWNLNVDRLVPLAFTLEEVA